MTLQEYQGLAGPRTLHLNSHGALPPLSSPGRCGTRCEALGSQAVCKQASPASLRDAHAGPGGGSQARLRPGQTPLHTPGRAGIQAPRGLPGRAGPSRSPRASGLPRDAGKEGPKHQSNAVDTAAAAAAGRAVRPARGQPPGPPGGRRRFGMAGGGGGRPGAESLLLLLRRAPARPQDPPRSLAVLRGLWSLRQRRLRPRVRPAASAPGPPHLRGTRGAPRSQAGDSGCGGTTEVLQTGSLGEASSSVAVAAPATRAAGPQRPLDPTSGYGAGTAAAALGTSGRERLGARPGGGGAPARPAQPAARP
ncbi:uncharacterized protein [Castor canadensis]|uniref:Uncharacterized protein n=1 Tax=Castor canadensis TaxID=51338 RepID=A0AC58N225_CASCN